jgi:hypothetical protein
MTARPDLETVKAMLVDVLGAGLLKGQTTQADDYDSKLDFTRPTTGPGFNCISIRDGGFYVALMDADKLATAITDWFAARYDDSGGQ